MCWKNEWARALNNINWAIIHIARARIKLEKRNNQVAVKGCGELDQILIGAQRILKILIETHGITRVKGSTSTEEIMEGRRKKKGEIQAWVQKH